VNNNAFTAAHRGRIIALATLHRLPAIYPFRSYATDGGLLSYGSDAIDQWRQAASYVDRVLRGEKPADLPVQAPTRYQMAINLKTAKALGLTIPPMLLAIADEMIE
jgi:putative tryptophan/tyrosine transport system substrate-binding protein